MIKHKNTITGFGIFVPKEVREENNKTKNSIVIKKQFAVCNI